MSGADYLARGEEILFVKDNICNWQEPPLPLVPFPACRFNQSATKIGIPDVDFTIFRPETSEIEYGFLNAAGQLGSNKNLLDEKSLPGVTDCGVNLPSPDNITPKRMEATIWAVPKGHELDPTECVALMRESKTWQSVNCQTANMVSACVDVKNPRLWQLGLVSVIEADAAAACIAHSSARLTYSVPASGYENNLLYDQLIRHASSSVVGVWLNVNNVVANVYSTDQIQASTPFGQHVKEPPMDDIVAVQ